MMVDGLDGPGGGTVCIELDDVQRFNEFGLISDAGIKEVFGSLDGVTFTPTPIALENKSSVTPGTRQISTSTDVPYYFFGNYKALRILTQGPGSSVGTRLICGKIGRD